ncbi:MAG: gliding motility-associated C-terminal domain-containing protein, partial [Bacteroidota bacterium]|nr:gliding motility-associated C-terminal domain-containing protein [Bacteroidota bacterium]
VAGTGNHNITYSFNNACANSDQVSIEVQETADATIDPAGPFCSDDDPVELSVSQTGGVWSGDEVDANGWFDPVLAGVGIHSVIYTINDPCGDDDTLDILVEQAYDVEIEPAGPFSVSDDPVILQVNETGGAWTGEGVNEVSGMFTPDDAGIGEHEISYTITGMCGDSDTVMINVNDDVDGNTMEVVVSNVLTPNNDGLNDTWKIEGISTMDEVEISIYTRWGDVVFEFNGNGNEYADINNQFDGTYNGKNLPMGNYVYMLSIDSEVYKGTLSLIR